MAPHTRLNLIMDDRHQGKCCSGSDGVKGLLTHPDAAQPENILVISSPDSYPHVQLADFGMAFASANQETERVDQAGERQHIPWGRSASVGGTVHYLSPDALLAKTKHTCYDPFAVGDVSAIACLNFALTFGFSTARCLVHRSDDLCKRLSVRLAFPCASI